MRSWSLPLLPKAACAFFLPGWQGCLENRAKMRSRLRLQTPRRWGEGTTSPLGTHTPICHPSQERAWSPESRWRPWEGRPAEWRGDGHCGLVLDRHLPCPLKPQAGPNPLWSWFLTCNLGWSFFFLLLRLLWGWNVLRLLGVCGQGNC